VSGRKLKQTIREILETETLHEGVKRVLFFPYSATVGPLISFFCSKDPLVKWKAVSVLGSVTAKIAETDPDYARVIMRRLMWSLNDESGGIGWGVPEAMGEIMALSDLLAGEYQKILVSYISPGANFIEVPALQKGALWGIGRLASTRPHYLNYAIPALPKFFDSEDPAIRGLSAFALLAIDPSMRATIPLNLINDPSPIEYYLDGVITTCPIKSLLETIPPV
jgi:hypothetical protein